MNDRGAILPTVITIVLLSTAILLYVNDLTTSHMTKLVLLEEHYTNQATLIYAGRIIESRYSEERPEQLSFSFNTGKVLAEKRTEDSYHLTFIGGRNIPSSRDVNLIPNFSGTVSDDDNEGQSGDNEEDTLNSEEHVDKIDEAERLSNFELDNE